MSTGRPHLSSYQQRVMRRARVKLVAPFLVVFLLGFAAAWALKPGPQVVDKSSGCTYTSVIPAKVLPAPKQIIVNVYNSTKRVGLASITSVDLKIRGFRVATVGSSPEDIKGIAYIRYGAGQLPAAQRLAAYVPGALLEKKPAAAKDGSVDLVLGSAFGSIAPDDQAAAILSVPSTQASGKSCPVL